MGSTMVDSVTERAELYQWLKKAVVKKDVKKIAILNFPRYYTRV